MDNELHFQQRLQRMRREILLRTGSVEQDLRRRRNPDSEERALEIQNDPVLEQLGEDGRRELREIDAALARIEAGSYGRCERCGGTIDPERLEALPFATSCIGCASAD